MRFRFTLSHESVGSIEIDEPIGWRDATLKMERHEEFHSLIEYFEGSFILYGNNGEKNGGIDFVKAIERDYGPDATLIVQIDLTYNEVDFINVFDGQYKIVDLEEMPGNKMRIPIIRDDFWAKFIARIDTPVDIKSATDLDDQQTALSQEVNLKLESQIIDAEHYSYEQRGRYIQSVEDYIQYSPDKIEIDEIKEYFQLPNTYNPEKPVWIFGFEYGGNLEVDIRIEYDKAVFVPNDGHENPRTIFDWFIQKNEEAPIEFDYTVQDYNDASVYDSWGIFNPGDDVVTTAIATFQGTFQVAKGDVLRVYLNRDSASNLNIAFWGHDGLHVAANGDEAYDFSAARPLGMVETPTYFRFKQHTIYPQTNSEAFLIHDVGAAITDRIIGQLDTFYSEHLGGLLTQARTYAENGCAWAYALVKGLQLRNYTLSEKPFFMSFMQWWKGVNPILNLSLMYDTVEGSQVIRIEKKEYQYDMSSGTSVNFSYVHNITRKFDPDYIFNKVEIGYTRWESEDVSGIDDPQAKKSFASRFKKIGKPLQILSEFIAASLAIETTRRQSRQKSADYKYDNETFIISLNPDLQEESPDVSPDLLQFMPEFAENFNSVTNLLNPNYRYNLRITPSRNFLRWKNYIQGALQHYVGSLWKFVSGQGNYDLTTEMMTSCDDGDYGGASLSEKSDISVDDDYLHLAMPYEMEIPMEWEEYETIRDNRRKPIGISQTDTDHVPMFIKTLEYKPAKGSCTIVAWAREYLELMVVDDIASTTLCYVQDECEGGITDNLGEFLTDELGVCITE